MTLSVRFSLQLSPRRLGIKNYKPYLYTSNTWETVLGGPVRNEICTSLPLEANYIND